MKAIHVLFVSALLAVTAPAFSQAIVVNTGEMVNCSTISGASGFDVNSFSLGGTDPLNIGSASSGAGAGKITLSNLTISKNFDKCSEALTSDFLTGKTLPTVTLTQYHRSGNNPSAVVVKITLSNAIITSWQLAATNPSVPQENVSFAFQKLTITSTTVNADGSTGATTTVSWDLTANAAS